MHTLRQILLFSIAAMAVVTVSPSSYGAFYIEPYVSKEMGDLKGSITQTSPASFTSNLDDSIDGLVYGAKLAYSMEGYGFGGDITLGNITVEEASSDVDYAVQDIGGFVQIRFANRWRWSATYYLMASLKTDDDAELKGSGFKMGLGYVFLEHMSVHFDYTSINYDEASAPGKTYGASDADRSSYLIGVSFPYEF